MRILAALAAVVLIAGCSTAQPEGSSRARATTEKMRDERIRIMPVVGANVERGPGVMYCASCGGVTDKRGVCACNGMGMPSFGIQATGRQKRSTTLGIDPEAPVRRSTSPR